MGEIEIRRVYNASPQRVWDAWTRPDEHRAQRIVDEGPADSPGVLYAQALIDHAAGRPSDALHRAIALEPLLAEEAKADGLST